MTIEEIWSGYYLPDKKAKCAPSTVAGYESSMKKYVLPRWGGFAVEEVDIDQLQEWVNEIEPAGASEKAFKCLRQVIRWWIRRKRLTITDPTSFIELKKKKPYSPQASRAKGGYGILNKLLFKTGFRILEGFGHS